MNSLNANVSGKEINSDWAGLYQPIENRAVNVTETSLLELIGAIDEVLQEEATPGGGEVVAAILSDLLETGRMKFKNGLRNLKELTIYEWRSNFAKASSDRLTNEINRVQGAEGPRGK